MDVARLEAARAILVEQLQAAPDGRDHLVLSDITDTLALLSIRVAAREIAPMEQPLHIKELPAAILRPMLATGRDTWVADLLGWPRAAVSDKRKRLCVPAHRRDGDGWNRIHAHRVWEQSWRQKLETYFAEQSTRK